ncbi:MAG: Hpt domain-containing protein [Pararhodobacter sp.]|nr:Hpt domain-containing protein [Pararhodobacter sp.]
MNKNLVFDDSSALFALNIDESVLSGIFEFGDEEMRIELCNQLLDDYRRMAAALDGGEPVIVAKVAHELKGLSSTIGAQRLADLAETLHTTAERVSPSALSVLTLPVRQEVDAVLSLLETCAKAFRRP